MITLTLALFFLACAFVCFLLCAFKVTARIVDFWPLGWAFVMLAVIFGTHF
jgi:hypothetical protein